MFAKMHSVLQITGIFEICSLFKQGQFGLPVLVFLPSLQHHHFNRWVFFIAQLINFVKIMDYYWGIIPAARNVQGLDP